MKKILKSVIQFFLNTFVLLKSKLKHMIFNLLDAVNEQTADWYFLDFDIESKDGKDHFKIPMFACMQSENDAKSLQNQIAKELIVHLFITNCSIDKISKEMKDSMIKDLELKFTSNDVHYLKTVIMKAVKKKVKNLNITHFGDDASSTRNLDIDTDYDKEKVLKFKIKTIKNQGVPLSQIQDFFVIEIDKSKVDPTTAIKEPDRPKGGDIDRSLDLINKMNQNKK